MQGKLVKKTRLGYESGYIYFINDDGNVCRVPESNNPGKRIKTQILSKTKIKKELGYVYYLDDIGDIRRTSLEKIELKNLSKQKVKAKK